MKTVPLGSIAKFIRGVTFKPDQVVDAHGPDAIGVVRTKNVQRELDLSDVVYIPDDLVGRQDQLIQPDDILISSANSWNLVGKCCWVPQLAGRYAIGGFITGLRAGSAEVHPRYLYLWLASERVQAELRNTANQTTNIANLNLKRCEQLPFPLPPIDEQRRITVILDQAHMLLAQRLQALARLDELAKSVFFGLFGEPIGDETRWPVMELGDIARIVRGASPRPAGDPRYFGGSIPWLKISDLTASMGRTVTEIKEGVTEAGCERSVLLPPGTLVLSNSATVGLPKVIEPSTCIHDGFLAFLDLDRRVERDWLYAALAASRARLVALAPEGTQKNLNTGIVKNVRMGIPPHELQVEYLRQVSELECLRGKESGALAEMRCLSASLQSRAFADQL